MAGFGFGNYINPQVGGFIDQRRNALAGLGAGLLNGQPGAGVQAGIQADDAYATQQKAEKERAEQIAKQQELRSRYAEMFTKAGAEGYATAVMDPAKNPADVYFDWMKRSDKQFFNVGDGTIVGVDGSGKSSVVYGGGEAGGQAPPYDGTSMDAQNWNILLTGDPATPEYAAAWSQINQPKMTLQQTEQGMVPVWSTPQLPANIRPPVGMTAQPSAAGAPPAGGNGGVSVGGALPGTQKPPTEQRARAQMMDSVISPEVTRLLGDGKNAGTFDALGNGWDVVKDSTGTAGRFAPFGIGTPSEDYLKAKSAVRTIIASYLYVASGATANPGEVENQAAVLTPQVNDPPDVVADKKARLKNMADAVRALARGENVDLGAVSSGGGSDIDGILKGYGL